MSLYAIGDLHLSFSVDKPMDVFGRVWKNHEKKIWKYWNKRVTDRDTVVVTGDHSWGRNLEQSRKDLEFIAELPGRKILLRGNHDMFWDAKKTQRLNEAFRGRLEFLQNNWFAHEDYALVGTKGYCYEGLDTYEHFEKIRDRELERLRISFEAARMSGISGEKAGISPAFGSEEIRPAGNRKYIMFLHYPPTSIGEASSPFTRMAEAYGAAKVVYSHCHGKARFDDSFKGYVNGIEYKLVSGDYLNFKPELILES